MKNSTIRRIQDYAELQIHFYNSTIEDYIDDDPIGNIALISSLKEN